MKKILIILGGVLLALIVLGLAKDMIIKSAVEVIGTQVLGASVKVDKLSLGVLSQSVNIEGFKVANPAGFPSGNLLDIRQAKLDVDVMKALKGDIHLRVLILRLNEMNVIKDKDGNLNVNSLKIAQQKQEEGGGNQPQDDQGKKQAKVPPLSIDTAIFDLGKVVAFMAHSLSSAGHAMVAISLTFQRPWCVFNTPQPQYQRTEMMVVMDGRDW